MGKIRTVVVTGGSKGIGAAISEAFYELGDRVVIAARNDNGLAKKLGARAMFFKNDVSRPEELMALAKEAKRFGGGIDVWINNAGFSEWHPVSEITEDFWDRMINTNLKGVLFGCKAADKYLKKGGVILNTSSIASKRGTPNNSVYCASKFGINGITQALAKELGPRGVRVNAVCPVLVKTEGLVEALKVEGSPATGKTVDQFLSDFLTSNSALKRLPTAREVANFYVFLASDEASAITGQCMNVDCGVFTQ